MNITAMPLKKENSVADMLGNGRQRLQQAQQSLQRFRAMGGKLQTLQVMDFVGKAQLAENMAMQSVYTLEQVADCLAYILNYLEEDDGGEDDSLSR